MALVVFANTLIDGTGRDPLQRGAVRIEQGKLVQVGPRNTITISPGDQVLDAGDGVILPGLIDAHCHIFGMKKEHSKPAHLEPLVEIVARGLASANQWLDLGVTTIRDLGTKRNLDLQLRDEIAAGRVRGPRIFGSGRPIAMTGGLRAETEEKALQVNGANDARHAAREQLRAGVDLIKLFASAGIGGGEGKLVHESGWEQLTVEEMAAAVAEAHRAGRRVAAHAIGLQSIRNALAAGVDSIEHGTYMDEECVAQMKQRGTCFVPTLAVTQSLAEEGLALGYQPNIPARAQVAVTRGRQSVAMAHAAGIPIATGTDPVICNTMLEECEALLKCGLTPMQVIQAATANGARVIGWEKKLGSLEPGKIADLIVLARNPLDDMRALAQVNWVVQDGKIVKQPSAALTN